MMKDLRRRRASCASRARTAAAGWVRSRVPASALRSLPVTVAVTPLPQHEGGVSRFPQESEEEGGEPADPRDRLRRHPVLYNVRHPSRLEPNPVPTHSGVAFEDAVDGELLVLRGVGQDQTLQREVVRAHKVPEDGDAARRDLVRKGQHFQSDVGPQQIVSSPVSSSSSSPCLSTSRDL
jgi:hypothetical protein